MKNKTCRYLSLLLCFLLLGNTTAIGSTAYTKKNTQALDPVYHFQLKSAPEHAWHDIKSSFWGWPGLGLVLGLGASAAFYPLDDNVTNKLSNHPIFGKKADDVIGNVFSPYTYAGVSFVTFLLSNTSQNSKLTLAMESSSEAALFSMALVGAGKLAFRRQRPNGANYSLPSAHSAAAFSTAAVLTEFYGWPAAIPAYAIASLVAVSRLDANVHHLTDVLVGAVLGSVIGVGTSIAHKKDHANFFIMPQVSSHEAGFVFYKPY